MLKIQFAGMTQFLIFTIKKTNVFKILRIDDTNLVSWQKRDLSFFGLK